jgi:phenylalanyl-tRNA synthetase beta chain
MKISVRWLNEYLEPGDVTPQQAEEALTFGGFPIESATPVDGGDTCLDVEVTSNRGDVLSHIGAAREVAARTGRRLRVPAANRTFAWFSEPEPPAPAGLTGGSDVGSLLAVDNRVAETCPLFTARVVRGVKVGPSPRWLVAALESVGQRSINNVVDLTNFVAAEYGQPTHVFDLATIGRAGGAGGAGVGGDDKARLIIRAAEKGEKLALLDGRTITLGGGELVVGDEPGGAGGGPRVISLAGIMGGSMTGVTDATADVLIEAATWDPVSVRTAARRHGLRTDASYRFERVVDPRTIETPARRLAALIVRLAGGRLLPGVIHAGREPRPATRVPLRPSRCAAIIGMDVSPAQIQTVLEAHEVRVEPEGSGPGMSLGCTIPAHRPDLEREIDLIEEVARTVGLDKVPVHEKIGVRVGPPQDSERAAQTVHSVLTGSGFFEAVTFTFVTPKMAKAFTPAGLETLEVHDERRKADPVLRPSVLPSLLACRRKNQDGGVKAGSAQGGGEGGVRLYEIASVFAQRPSQTKGERGREVEAVRLAMIADACFPAGAKAIEQKQAGVRLVRGVLESLASALSGAAGRLTLQPGRAPGLDPAACVLVHVDGAPAGAAGLIAPGVLAEHGLETPIACAEIDLAPLLALYPPRSAVQALPQFPPIERDLSLIVAEGVAWASVEAVVAEARPALLESCGFVGVYRGPQAGAGNKSVTMRLRFRDPARTLTHEEVSPQVEAVVELARRTLKAQVRTG